MTQLRSVSGLMPNCSPIRFNAPDRVAGSRRASTASLVARSRSSSGYFLGAAMTLILTWIESLHQTRGGTGVAVEHRGDERVGAAFDQPQQPQLGIAGAAPTRSS